MKILKFLAVVALGLFATSCNFTETMTLNEDGSGKLSVFFDGSELLAMGGGAIGQDTTSIDSILNFKDFIEENRDSISTLSADEQAKIMKLERFKMHVVMNSQEQIMTFDMYTDFNDVSEANDILEGFEQLDGIMGSNASAQDSGLPVSNDQQVKVKYSFKNNVFIRDAYVLDKEKYKIQADSMQSMALFFGTSKYKLKYTFPRKIKETNREEATYSADGKTLYYEVNFMDYLSDPNIIDIEVELEN